VDPAAPDGAAEQAMTSIAARREGSGGAPAALGGGGGGDTSLMDFLAVAQEAYKRRQRDRYVNYTSPISGYGALHLAAEKGLAGSVRLLLESGANPDLPDGIRANCALHLAAREGRRPTVDILVRHGASLTTINEVWYTSLHLAARYGSLDILTALLDAADAQGVTQELIDMPRKDGTCPLHSAVESSYEGVVHELLARGAFW
jgi:ankyrin repeat protein